MNKRILKSTLLFLLIITASIHAFTLSAKSEPSSPIIQPQKTPPPPPNSTPIMLSQTPIEKNGMPTLDTELVDIKIRAYLYPGIDETEYRDFIDLISTYFQQQEQPINFVVTDIILLQESQECGWSTANIDVINCVGSGMGGYFGKPYYRIGLNTDAPWGFNTTWGLHSAAHEFAHFFGLQDLYWLQTDDSSSHQAPAIPWPEEIMFNHYHPSPTLSDISKQVIQENLTRFSSGSVGEMLLVSDRMADNFIFSLPEGNSTCNLFTRTRNQDTFQSHFTDIPTLSVTLDNNHQFTMNAVGIDNVDKNFDLYFLQCNAGNYWMHSRVVEEAYFLHVGHKTVSIECSETTWCQLKPLNYKSYLPLIIN